MHKMRETYSAYPRVMTEGKRERDGGMVDITLDNTKKYTLI